MDTHFYSLHVCRADDDGGIRVKTSGYEGDIHYTGEEHIPASSPNIEAWRWLHLNRKSFPPVIEQSEFAHVVRAFHEGVPEPRIPDDGYYFIAAGWSAPAVMASQALYEAQSERYFPRGLHTIDNDSNQCRELFPHLEGFLQGWGELFGFSDGVCDLYFQLGRHTEGIARRIEFLYENP